MQAPLENRRAAAKSLKSDFKRKNKVKKVEFQDHELKKNKQT
jgi:hypothetical protein